MGLFKIFKKSDKKSKKGFHDLIVKDVVRLTSDTVKIVFEIPEDEKKDFHFIAGQYVNLSIENNGKEERRSYSICSGPGEDLAIAVKEVDNGNISILLNESLVKGDTLLVSKPLGHFTLKENEKDVVAIAAGSGITPIMAIAKTLEKNGGKLRLLYGNRNRESIIFKDEISSLKNTQTTHFLTKDEISDHRTGRITKDSFTSTIKEDLSILKADAFFICGPEQMIIETSETLKFFGVSPNKIHFELFTTPVLMKKDEGTATDLFNGVSKVQAILDGEKVEFELSSKGKVLLEAVENEGLDAPYSCKGGVCCSCKAKVLKGHTTMEMNYSLTDEEVKEGYILTCQAHPASEELTITFDE